MQEPNEEIEQILNETRKGWQRMRESKVETKRKRMIKPQVNEMGNECVKSEEFGTPFYSEIWRKIEEFLILCFFIF